MEIIKQGKDMSKAMTCPTCGCIFLYLPGDVEIQHDQIYNVPEELWRCHGGTYDPVEIKHRRIVRCPSCKLKCDTEK